MVCLGNICRSPMAEGLLLAKIEKFKLNAIVDSAGTANYHIGKAPDRRMVQMAASKETPIDFLRARQFSEVDFQNNDLILVMDHANYRDVLRLARSENDKDKVRFLLDYLYPEQQLKVPDPYYGTEEDFEEVYNLLDKATDALIKHLFNEG